MLEVGALFALCQRKDSMPKYVPHEPDAGAFAVFDQPFEIQACVLHLNDSPELVFSIAGFLCWVWEMAGFLPARFLSRVERFEGVDERLRWPTFDDTYISKVGEARYG